MRETEPNKEAIVISGMGIVSGLGLGLDATLSALYARRSTTAEAVYLQTSHRLPVVEVQMSNAEMLDYLGLPADSRITRTPLMGLIAIQEAMRTSHWEQYPSSSLRRAFISGTTVGGMDRSELYYEGFFRGENVEYIALHDCGASTEIMADAVGEVDLVTTLSTACSSAANAIILGANLIRTGRVDQVMVGGSECLSRFHLNGFNTLKILDSRPCRPFDASHEGLNLGEGAAFLVMERESLAKERGLQPSVCLSGYGNACDAYHQTATSPEGEGAYRAMMKALQSSGLQPEDIDYINAHGTGTVNNDETEAEALRRVFGEKMPPVSSTKAFTGHTTSASGSVEAVISILALEHGFCPVNLHFSQKMDKAVFEPVHDVLHPSCMCHVMSNSFGFGGNDSSCIFSRCH